MKEITYIHFSDLHIGDQLAVPLLSAVKGELLSDLEFIKKQLGHVDIMFLEYFQRLDQSSGDVTRAEHQRRDRVVADFFGLQRRFAQKQKARRVAGFVLDGVFQNRHAVARRPRRRDHRDVRRHFLRQIARRARRVPGFALTGGRQVAH